MERDAERLIGDLLRGQIETARRTTTEAPLLEKTKRRPLESGTRRAGEALGWLVLAAVLLAALPSLRNPYRTGDLAGRLESHYRSGRIASAGLVSGDIGSMIWKQGHQFLNDKAETRGQ